MSPFPTAGQPWVCLASGSPQRRAILEELGIPYRLVAVDVAEIVAATPRETVEENARRKLCAGLLVARASRPCVQEEARPGWPGPQGAIVMAADTVLEVQGRLLGKPADEAAAVQYLQMLSGGTATAYSAVAVTMVGAAEGCLAAETAEVHFKPLSQEIIQWYVSTGEPMGRAGAFGISRLGEVLTESIDGCHSCVAGLPKTALLLALARVLGEGKKRGHSTFSPPVPRPSTGVEEEVECPLFPEHPPEWLRRVPAGLVGTRVQLRSLPVGVGHEIDHRHDDQREER